MTALARALIYVASYLACVLGNAGAMAGNAPAADPPPAPIGLDADGALYALLSNKGWTIAGRPAREVKVLRKATAGSRDVRERQDEAYIWAATCTLQAQQIVFQRTFFLPGPAKTLGAVFEATNSFYANTRPIRYFQLRINGKLVLNVAGSLMDGGRFTVAEAASSIARAIQYGNNVFEVEVGKAAQTTQTNKCVESGTPLGFHFDIFGSFEADLFLTKTPNVIEDCYFKVDTPAKGMGLNVVKRFAAMQNLGPSGSYRPHINIKVVATGSTEIAIANVATMGMTCEPPIVQSKVAWFLDCDIDPWPQGLSPGLKFLAAAKLALDSGGQPIFSKPYFQVKAILSSKTGDPKSSNVDEFRAHLCQPASTDPKCATPSVCRGLSR